MKAFEVSLNGQHLLTAGIGDDGVLTAITTLVLGDSRPNKGLTCHVGGIQGGTNENIEWKMPEIKTGDEIKIKVVESDQFNTNYVRRAIDPEKIRAQLDAARARLDGTA